ARRGSRRRVRARAVRGRRGGAARVRPAAGKGRRAGTGDRARRQGAPRPRRGRGTARCGGSARVTDPYARESDPAKRHSAALTNGVDRAPARAMLKGIGLDDEALARPLVGISTTWIETMPCNWNQRELARHVRRGILDAGGTPVEFNTIAVSDGVSMGTEGMRASLVS